MRMRQGALEGESKKALSEDRTMATVKMNSTEKKTAGSIFSILLCVAFLVYIFFLMTSSWETGEWGIFLCLLFAELVLFSVFLMQVKDAVDEYKIKRLAQTGTPPVSSSKPNIDWFRDDDITAAIEDKKTHKSAKKGPLDMSAAEKNRVGGLLTILLCLAFLAYIGFLMYDSAEAGEWGIFVCLAFAELIMLGTMWIQVKSSVEGGKQQRLDEDSQAEDMLLQDLNYVHNDPRLDRWHKDHWESAHHDIHDDYLNEPDAGKAEEKRKAYRKEERIREAKRRQARTAARQELQTQDDEL